MAKVRQPRPKRVSARIQKKVESQLARLESAELLRRLDDSDLSYWFKHVLTQDAAYNSLLHKTRREIHRAVAEAYEKLYPDHPDEFAALLAQHYAEAGDDAKTSQYAIRAGDVAARKSANTEARANYEMALHALAQLPDSEDLQRARVDTLLKQVNAAWGVDTADQNLARLFDAESLARTLPEQDRLRLARVRYWIGRVYQYNNDHRKAAQYYEQALTAARQSEDEELLALASALGARTYHLQGYFGKAVPLFQQAIPYLARIGNWPDWVLAKTMLAISLGAQGKYHEGRMHGDEVVAKALMLDDRQSLAIARLMAARVELMAGDLQRFLNEIRDEMKVLEAINPLTFYMALGFQAWAHARLGRSEAARARMAAADAVAAQFGTRLIFADWFMAIRAEIELTADNVEQAIQLAEEAVVEAQAAGSVFGEGIAQRAWGQALAARNPPEYTQAIAHLEKSLKRFEEGDAVIEAARTHLAWGKILRERGEWQSAREHFDKAAAQFEASGLVRELTEARELIESMTRPVA